jgi:hypothetical protein
MDVLLVVDMQEGILRGLSVREPSAYLERLPRWRRALWSLSQRAGFGDVSFDITGMDIDSDELVRLIRERAGCR